MPISSPLLYIGLMSGTSLDGVDGALASFATDGTAQTLATAYLPFPPELHDQLMALQKSGNDEIHREAQAANALARLYAQCVRRLLEESGKTAAEVHAIGAHGQTIRHRPELGYSRQANNPALLAELTGIDVIADFRSRDIAAGGQGAPLVPAFHRAVFGTDHTRVVANIGGIGNISILPASVQQDVPVLGFDTGPGNVLLDGWIARHQGKRYDENGQWGASGKPLPNLLEALRADGYFTLPPPKSTGRDLFHMAWLDTKLAGFATARPEDIQSTLTALTATTLADAIASHAPQADAVYVCGGGAYNQHLMQLLRQALAERDVSARLDTTAALGIPPNHVEALAFAWLAHRFSQREAGNLAAVTGAAGPRLLGALYPT